MPQTSFVAVAKPALGFTVHLPPSWAEFPPVLTNSPYEVARFACQDQTFHLCIVFRLPGSPGFDARVAARRAQAALERKGFSRFSLTDSSVGGLAGARLDFDKTNEDGTVWSVREYYVSVGNLVYALGLGTSDPAGDAELYDRMASEFDVSSR